MEDVVELPPDEKITEELNRIYGEGDSCLDPVLLSFQVLSLYEWLAEPESDSAG